MVQGSFPGKGQHFCCHNNVVKYFLVFFLEGGGGGRGARSRWRLIGGDRFELFVIGYPRDSHLNNANFNGFLSQCFFQFSNL